MRGGRRDQRGRERDPDGGIQGRRARGREPVRQRGNAAGHQRRDAGGQDRREELIAEQEQPPRRHDRSDEQDERPQDQQVAGGLPEPPQEPGEVVDQLGDPLVDRRRVRRHDRDQPEGRGGEQDQDHIRRPAGPRGVGAGGEEADAEVGLVAGDPGPGPPTRRPGSSGPARSGRVGRRPGASGVAWSSIGFTDRTPPNARRPPGPGRQGAPAALGASTNDAARPASTPAASSARTPPR